VRERRPLFVASLVIALVVAVGGGWLLSNDPQDDYTLDETVGSIALNKVAEGKMLATVQVQDTNDNVISTELWLGEPLVINFWFSTCEPCRREFPVLVAADERFPDIRFIGVNLNDSNAGALAFMQKYGATFDTFFDRDGQLTNAMGVATTPVTLLVDAGGVVRRQLTGEITSAMLHRAIAEVFPT
jgi:thiol-disulfide isomerase/thioredoxin